MKNINKHFIFAVIILLAFLMRFYKLGEVPKGFHHDEVSQAYNSFSIVETGLDRFGEKNPILFRSFGSFQPPIYTYLTTIPIAIFGNTMFSVRFISAIFGVITVALTYFLSGLIVNKKYKTYLPLIFSLVVAISPWAIHFSRRAVEANIGLTLFLLFLYFFIQSLKNAKNFVFALFFLGLSTHAYYSERLIAVIVLPIFIFQFRKYFIENKKWVLAGLVVLALTLLPHLVTVLSGSFFARFDQVGSSTGKFLSDFIRHLFGYFSPMYLFSDAGFGLSRISPNLGMFYGLLVFPFFVGLYKVTKIVNYKYHIFLFTLIFISLIPASLTGDDFYPLRILEFLWIVSFVISIGVYEIGMLFKNKVIRLFLLTILITYSLLIFYISYFVLYQNETLEPLSTTYIQLSEKLSNYNNYSIVIDSPRDPAIGLRLAFFRSVDPRTIQEMLRSQIGDSCNVVKNDSTENYKFQNIETRSLNWGKDRCSPNTILIGDILTFSEPQIKEHKLIKEFEIKDNNIIALYGYRTNPDSNCLGR
ncbi:MAG: glycosyltransferase family 39 protein [Microgenomates group bacterium]